MIKFAIVLFVSAVLCEASVLKESCSTSSLKEGLCVNLQDCPSISSMSNDFVTPMTVERLNYLIESLCGYANKTPRVCCPVEEVVTAKTEETETTNPEMVTSAPIREEITTSEQIEEQTLSSNEIR